MGRIMNLKQLKPKKNKLLVEFDKDDDIVLNDISKVLKMNKESVVYTAVGLLYTVLSENPKTRKIIYEDTKNELQELAIQKL